MPCRRRRAESEEAERGPPRGFGNTSPSPSPSWRASARTARAWPESGTLCARQDFVRWGGTVQRARSRSISSQGAPRTSRERVAVRTANSSASFGDGQALDSRSEVSTEGTSEYGRRRGRIDFVRGGRKRGFRHSPGLLCTLHARDGRGSRSSSHRVQNSSTSKVQLRRSGALTSMMLSRFSAWCPAPVSMFQRLRMVSTSRTGQ